jgi:hypothetical protein
MNPRLHWWIASAGWVLCLLLYLTWREGQVYLHFLLTQVCHGVSSGKILFFLLFMAALYARLGMSRGPAVAGRWPEACLGVGVLGLVASLLSHLLYVRGLGLPLDWASWHWRDGINSVTSLTHVHTSKAPIAMTLEALGLHRAHRSFDTGWVYMDAAPGWLMAVIGLSFLLSLVGWLACAGPVVLSYPQRQRAAVALVYGMAAAAVSKSILDGGLLAYDAVAGLLTLALLIEARDVHRLPQVLHRRGVWLVAVLASWAGVIIAFDPGSMHPQLERLVYRLAIHALVLGGCAAVLATTSRQRTGWRAATALSVLAAGILFVQDLRHTLLPLHRRAPRVAWRYDEAGRPQALEVAPGLSYKQAYLALGQNPCRVQRLSLPERGVKQPDEVCGMLAEMLPLDARRATLPSDSDGVVRIRRAEVDEAGGARRIRLQIEFDPRSGPCVCCPPGEPMTQLLENERFVGYHLLDGRLVRAGFTRYVVIPYAFYRQDAATAAPPDSSSGLVQAGPAAEP